MNMKKKSSEKFSNLSSYSKGTGGGPPEIINFTILDEEFKEISGVKIVDMTMTSRKWLITVLKMTQVVI
jgi:hypothetical protein